MKRGILRRCNRIETRMLRYKKWKWCFYAAVFVLVCLSCTGKNRETGGQTCTASKSDSSYAVSGGVNAVRVILDDTAKAAFAKRKITAVYCVTMGAS